MISRGDIDSLFFLHICSALHFRHALNTDTVLRIVIKKKKGEAFVKSADSAQKRLLSLSLSFSVFLFLPLSLLHFFSSGKPHPQNWFNKLITNLYHRRFCKNTQLNLHSSPWYIHFCLKHRLKSVRNHKKYETKTCQLANNLYSLLINCPSPSVSVSLPFPHFNCVCTPLVPCCVVSQQDAKCILEMGLLRQLGMLPHWEVWDQTSFLSQSDWHQDNQS